MDATLSQPTTGPPTRPPGASAAPAPGQSSGETAGPHAGPTTGQANGSTGAPTFGPLSHRLLDGRYEMGRLLARGGMATVYEAVDSRLGRTVAVKVMHPAFAADAEFVARFIREARSAARLSHPNVVAVYDQGSEADIVFLAMEFVPGGTLRDLLSRYGRLAPAHALPLYEQMLAALAAAHKAGLVHRDVKPENVLITDDGRVKVADFGLARAIASSVTNSATTGVVIGTVSYLSPEQVERSIADARSDVYSAGIVLYEMLTGEKPYRGATPMEVAFQHVHSRVPPPSRLAPGLPAELDTIVARATARDPDLRPPDAAELLDEVVRAREGRPLLLPPLADGHPTAGAETTVRHADEVPTSRRRADDQREGDTLVVGRTPLTASRAGLPGAGAPGTAPVGPPAPGPATAGWPDRPAEQAGDQPDPGEGLPREARRRRRRGWLVFLVVLLLGAVAAASAYWYAEGRFTQTPEVAGMAQADAIAEIERSGLEPSVAPDLEPDEIVPALHVLRTDPQAGARIVTGGEVLLYVSSGPERFTLPDVAGSTPDQAAAALQRDEMPLEVAATSKEEFSETVSAGAVIRTEPPSGTAMRREQTVTLVVSRGREALPVPDVRSLPLEEATAELAAAGFAVTSSEVFSDKVDAGLVVTQDTSGEAFRNDTVHLEVSQGPELFEVPGVLGQDTPDAERTLTDAGFVVDIIRVLPEPLTEDIVIRQSPGSGKHPAGTTITLYVI